MKISIINKLIVGALVATIVSGCGGSGVTPTPLDFTGISIPTFQGKSVKSIKNMNGSGEYVTPMPSNYQPTSIASDATGSLFVGTYEGTVLSIQNPGSIPTEMTVPAGKSLGHINGITFDHSGKLFINDRTNRKIVRVDDMSGAGWTELDYSPSLSDQLGNPDTNFTIAIDSLNRIYIASRNGSKIIRFDSMSDGSPVTFGAVGSGVGQFSDINDLHLDEQDRIYVADRQNNRIVRIDNMAGANWVSFGSLGSGTNQFNSPVSIATDSTGNIFVVDAVNGRIVRINDMTGTGWTTFGSTGSGHGKFESMFDILVR